MSLRWSPRRIGTQIVALAVAVIVIGHLLLFGAFALLRPFDGTDRPTGVEAALITAVRLIDHTSTPQAATQAVEATLRAYPDLRLAVSAAASVPMIEAGPLPRSLRRALGTEYPLWRTGDDSESADGVAIRLRSGTIVTAMLPSKLLAAPPLFGPMMVTLILLGVLVILIFIWAMRGIVAPLSRFSVAADQFDPDTSFEPLEEQGPEEVRKAAAAFNRMRDRINRMVEDRTRMLAAVSHDLRTPITRLRLRTDFIKDQAMREQMLSDLDHMNAMVQSALSFLRTGKAHGEAASLELSSLLKTVCDRFADEGSNVAYDGDHRGIVQGWEDELHRALTNLVQNAVKFGDNVVVRLRCSAERAEIDVEDDGPGIPDAEKMRVLKPFVRGDAARAMSGDSGFGLGLSIADAIAKAHGGSLELLDRQPNGLIVRLELPLARAPAALATMEKPRREAEAFRRSVEV
ncbi:MAG: ATP-binding protein [Hyphomicrobiales bacterium]